MWAFEQAQKENPLPRYCFAIKRLHAHPRPLFCSRIQGRGELKQEQQRNTATPKTQEENMALMHMQFKILKRSEGKSAVYLTAYNNRLRARDERTGDLYNYQRKDDLYYSEVMLPDNAPERFRDAVTLWNEVEKIEKRKDSQLARYAIIALQKELTPEQNKKLLKNYLQKNFVNKGMIADFAIHDAEGNNPHAHVMFTLREVNSAGFGNKKREWNYPELAEIWRKKWSYEVNKTFQNLNIKKGISHLSTLRQKEQLIDLAKTQIDKGEFKKAEATIYGVEILENKKVKKRIPRKVWMSLKNKVNNKKHVKKEETKKEDNKKFNNIKNVFNKLFSNFNKKRKEEKEIERLEKLKSDKINNIENMNNRINSISDLLESDKLKIDLKNKKDNLYKEQQQKQDLNNNNKKDLNLIIQQKNNEVKNGNRKRRSYTIS
ncbi:MobQ family relaxase [Providencia stuartii]|uniref:MobQ family relaxase n=1 Tax=Providencia stuartii TaxID=588 RepID=UPI0024ABA1EC|nr:MobQ family relaxase [Providencia stuartii]MCX3072563.1 MobA/MobL family protein [Providencia stuartii]